MTIAPRSLAERPDRGPLQVVRERERQVLGVVRGRPELAEGIGERVAGKAGQLGIERPLEPGGAVPPRGVPDDVADGRAGIDAVQLAVRVLLVAGEDLPVAVEDLPARDRS